MKEKDFGKCPYCRAKMNEIESVGEICDKCLHEETDKIYRK